MVNAGVGRTNGSYSGTVDLQNPPDTSCGCGEFDPEAVAQTILNTLLEGRAYVGISTQMFPVGELRGNFPTATAAGEPGPTLNPVPLPAGAWPAIATMACAVAFRTLRTRAKHAK